MGPNHIDGRLGLQSHYGVLGHSGVPHLGAGPWDPGTLDPWDMGYMGYPISLGYGVYGISHIPWATGYGVWDDAWDEGTLDALQLA